MRIDYPGTGDSSGHDETPGLVSLWERALDRASDALAAAVGGPVSVVGLRLGATLAGGLARRREIADVVAWNPVISGKRYVREQDAIRRVAGHEPRADDEVLEAGGFRMAPETVDAVKTMSLVTGSYNVVGHVLLIEREDLERDARLEEHLSGQGIATSSIGQPDYLDMVAEPQYTVVPDSTIAHVVDWLSKRNDASRRPVEQRALAELVEARAAAFDSVTEEMVKVAHGGSRPLSGVLTGPADGGGADAPVVVIINAGSVHHVGPNRFYVDLGRALAKIGCWSLRFDIRNLGDSVLGSCREENHPYPSTAVEDVRTALDWLASERGFRSFIVAGLCSGAHTAFHAGLELSTHSIAGVVPINPLTFYWDDSMSLDTPDTVRTMREARYYSRALRDVASWRRLVGGRSDIGYILGFIGRRLGQLLGQAGRRIGARLGLVGSSSLAQDLDALHARGRRIRFVFSSEDPGYEILQSQARSEVERLTKAGSLGVTLVPDADHTFSRKDVRDVAIRAIVDWIAATRSVAV
jgi:alpha/beta superfamily hydrolase